MKKVLGTLCAVALSSGMLSTVAQAQDAKLDGRLNDAATVLAEVMHTPDKGIPQSILAGASCVIVIPSVKKGAFGVGGEYGQGAATCRTGHGWSAPVFVRLDGASFGFQIGGSATDLVLVAMNHDGLQHLLQDKFKLGGDAAAAAGPVGRNTQASTDASLHAEFLTWSRSRGLFAGIDLSGASISQNNGDTRTFYGADVPYQQILAGNQATPPPARHFVGTVARYFVVSRANQ